MGCDHGWTDAVQAALRRSLSLADWLGVPCPHCAVAEADRRGWDLSPTRISDQERADKADARAVNCERRMGVAESTANSLAAELSALKDRFASRRGP